MKKPPLFLLLLLAFFVSGGAAHVYGQSTVTDRIAGVAASLAIKAPVRVATTANITLSGLQTIDGVLLVTGERVLVKNQTTASANGVYQANTSTWTRALDFDGNRDVVLGTAVYVTSGTTNANTWWRVTTANPVTIGTSSISWSAGLLTDSSAMNFTSAGAGAVSRTVQSRLRDTYSVKDFGAVGDCTSRPLSTIYSTLAAAQAVYPAVTALTQELDWAAWQAGLYALDNAASVRARAVGDVGAGSATQSTLYVPQGCYLINDALSSNYYTKIEGTGGEVFLKNSDDTKDTLTSAAFTAHIKGIHFIGGKRQLVLTRTNIDTSVNVFEDLTFSAGDYTQPAVYVNTQSVYNEFRNVRVLSRPFFMDVVIADKITIRGGWINGYAHSSDGNNGQKPSNTASIVLRSGSMLIDSVLFVPMQLSGNTLTRWIDNYGLLTITNTQFNGENAGFPVVYNYGSAKSSVSPYVTQTGVIMENVNAYTGNAARVDRGLVVLKDAVPAIMSFRNITGAAGGIFVNSSQMTDATGSAAAWLATNLGASSPKITIELDAHETQVGTFAPTELLPYTRYVNPGLNTGGINNYRFPKLSTPLAVFEGGTEPTCAVGTRGTLVHTYGGAGVADTFRICAKDGADAYAYRALY